MEYYQERFSSRQENKNVKLTLLTTTSLQAILYCTLQLRWMFEELSYTNAFVLSFNALQSFSAYCCSRFLSKRKTLPMKFFFHTRNRTAIVMLLILPPMSICYRTLLLLRLVSGFKHPARMYSSFYSMLYVSFYGIAVTYFHRKVKYLIISRTFLWIEGKEN